MKYKLYKEHNTDPTDIKRTFLENRGVTDYQKYLNLDDSVVENYKNLDNIDPAINLLYSHIGTKSNIGVLVDTDVDGYCSAAMIYSYIKRMAMTFEHHECTLSYIMHHEAKAHGLGDMDLNKDFKGLDLLIIPDAGTNDVEECKRLKEQGIDILILDHHICDTDNPYATIVNNQMSDRYGNKDLCGAGVVYKFMEACDDVLWYDYTPTYLDLCALANISDDMDMRSFETRYLTDKGLSNIKNKCFKALVEAQDYMMKSHINIHNIQWYITPIINACIRLGSNKEKELLFRAFIEDESETFTYKKRAAKNAPAETVTENIYDHVVRICKNIKTRQDKKRSKGLSEIEKLTDGNTDDQVIMVDASGLIDGGLTGVAAIKIAEKYNKPCILLSQTSDDEGVLRGSGRNFNHSPVESFKDVVSGSGVFELAQGHDNAFGVRLKADRVNEAMSALNKSLQDVEFDKTYYVDMILDGDDVTPRLILDFDELKDIVAQGLDEPLIKISDVFISRENVQVIGKSEDTIKFTCGDIVYIQFRCQKGDSLFDWLNDPWSDTNYIKFDLIGKPAINEYNGALTCQIIIVDTEIKEEMSTEKAGG